MNKNGPNAKPKNRCINNKIKLFGQKRIFNLFISSSVQYLSLRNDQHRGMVDEMKEDTKTHEKDMMNIFIPW